MVSKATMRKLVTREAYRQVSELVNYLNTFSGEWVVMADVVAVFETEEVIPAKHWKYASIQRHGRGYMVRLNNDSLQEKLLSLNVSGNYQRTTQRQIDADYYERRQKGLTTKRHELKPILKKSGRSLKVSSTERQTAKGVNHKVTDAEMLVAWK